ncbi:DUF1566 domain-containing protein [bacterium]|nr:DUF1566 domain-containing protein [bacterium]
MRRFLVFLAMLGLVFMVSCGDGNGNSSGKKQGELYGSCYPNKTCNEGLTCDEENNVCLPDGNDSDADDDTDTSDVEISDEDSDNPQEPDDDAKDPTDPNDSTDPTDTDDEDKEEPDERDDTDTDIPVTPDEDNQQEPEDHDTPETPDEDNETPVNPEATENHKISGIFQVGTGVSGIEAALYECGGTEKIAAANTDAKGKFSFNADITAAKTYCVKAGDFASCFKGLSDHTANISEITTAAYLLDKTCADMRKSETKIRTYAKLGTGEWLGELDYSKLSGISEGLKLLSNYLKTTNNKTISEKIAEDAKKETPAFGKFFNGFRISANKTETVIGESADNSTTFSVDGGSTKIASGFKIKWTMKNKTAEAATYKFTTSTPGEYVARAQLVSGSSTVSDGSASVLYLQKKKSGAIYLNGKSKNISHYIDNGIYVVIPKNTVVKKNGEPVTKITYDILSAGGNQVSRLKFYPEGAVFEGDSMYFVYELGTVYGGDPIMLSAKRTNADGSVDVLNSAAGDPIMMAAAGDPIMTTAAGDPIMQAAAGDPIMTNAAGDPIMTAAAGDPIMTSAAGDPIMTSAAGDPIMNAAAGDPIMTSAAGDPIMAAAAGDPIMMGTSSSTMISQTNHYSIFTVEAANLPVSVDALLDRWCDGSFYRNYSPVAFIEAGFQKYKPESSLLPYLTCDENRKFGDLGNDLYELINKQVGYQRNLNLIENIFYISEFYNRMNTRKANGEVAAVKNGLELRSAIAALYTATTAYNRSSTLADLFDSSMIPLTYSGATPADYTAKAKSAITGNSGSGDTYTATKKEMMIFANYITTSSKGPNFQNVESVLTPDQLVCAWFDSNTEPQNCNKIYTLNDAGHVALGGTELSAAEVNAIFSGHFMPMNSRLSDEEKLDLFRTFYLALKYAGTIFYGGSDIDELNDALLKTAYLVFDGIDDNAKAVSITDTFDASAHTVSVLEGAEMATVPYLTKLSTLTDRISLKVAAASAEIEKVLISIEGNEFEKVQENTRTYYKPAGSLKEKSIVLTPGTLAQGEKALKDLLGSENVDELGNITGKMTIVVNSKISGKTYSTQKTYEFFVNGESDGVNSKEVPANIQIRVNDSNGNAIPDNANPTIILNPGNKVYYAENGIVSIENLTPAAYTVDAFADGYYAKNVSVNVPSGAVFDVEIRLDEEDTTSADANLELSVKIDTIKHPSKVYIQIYNDDMDLVANETAKFNGEGRYETINIPMGSGRYTLLAVGEDMYNYLEAITLYEGNNSKEITVIAKNACGNGIVDSAEECEPSQSAPVLCGTIYPAAPNPDKHAVCDPLTCTFDKTECGKAALCGDGIIDSPAEHCDGGSKACAEIAGFGNSTGSAPCADDCSSYITANNCSQTTGSCGNLKENAVWNDGNGTFSQTYNGEDWIPATKAATFGLTKEECVFSCKKGYKWNGSACIPSPLSLALICTGETDCFNDTNKTEECPAYGAVFFGQDAQYANTRFCTHHDLTEAENGIFKDAYTHYEWQAASNEAMNWSDAQDYCSHLNDEGGSEAQWRIPSPTELMTILDNSTASLALGEMFTGKGLTFWAKEDNRNDDNAWMLGENGEITSVAKTETNSVICVKYDFDAMQNRFTATDETVKDNDSGLMWQKQPVASVTWEKALSYCEEVSTADKFDWRLPNRNELASLINYEKENGVVSDFPGIAAKGFWTSTSSLTGNEAWTVDFADGKIEATEKKDARYIICVRNDEPCFGDECPNACGFNACKGMANSTGLCTANDYSFTCGCKSGFNWNHGKCLLATTRYTACTGLPENGVWNSVFGISQSLDGENWYPSEVGTFNKTPSSTECRFICATNYTWDAENNKCQPKSTVTQCSEKKPNSEWNSVSRISQTWDGEKWVPSATSVYNMTESETECRFKCKEHYNWNDADMLCDPETQPATCIGLPANAHWWNDPATITQTWTNGGWAPTATGAHNTDAEENRCFFTCDENYDWNDTSCVAETRETPCVTTTDNSEWTGGFSSIKQTWNGSEWYPSEIGTYNTEANSSYCRFKCKENYNWNGSTCVAATRLASCTGNPANSQWNTVSSIMQTYMEIGENTYGWSPSNIGSYGAATTTECHFTCKENYEWINNECVGRKQIVECTGLPANAQWKEEHSTVEQQWNGTQGWLPSAVGQHNVVTGCSFECETEHYTWDSATSTCIGKTRNNQDCINKPDSAVWNTVSKINQTWNGKAWLPDLNATYNENSAIDECRFKCPVNYTWNGSTCEPRTQIVSCGTLPANAAWNTVSQIKQTWNGSTEKWEPAVNLEHNDTSSETECRYTCKTNYEPAYANANDQQPSCQAKKQTVACQGLPANAQWFYETIEQEWNGTTWAPTNIGIHSSDANQSECRFRCIEENDQYVWNNNTKTCDARTKENQPCTGKDIHSHWTNPTGTIPQTWTGTDWFPSTTGSYNESSDETQCYFVCDTNYQWDWVEKKCVGAEKTSPCGALPDHAQWNTASSIIQHWAEGACDGIDCFVPDLTPKYSTEATTAECRYKCEENYEPSGDGDYKSCVPATRIRNCEEGKPANTVWNTSLADGQIRQTWNGSDWEPDLTGVFGGQDAPASNSCIYKCAEHYDPDETNSCMPHKEQAQCDDESLPENAVWAGGFKNIMQTWAGGNLGMQPPLTGTFSTEADSNYCRFQCKENYTWTGVEGDLKDAGECIADTRVVDCDQRPAHSIWYQVHFITQTWNGSEWLPKTEPEYSVIPSDNECRYSCEEGYYPINGLCTNNPAEIKPNLCLDVDHSTWGVYLAYNQLFPYECSCESGYYWWGKTGCRQEKAAFGNICTDSDKCHSRQGIIECVPEGNTYYGQDAQFAEAGFCSPKNLHKGGSSEPVVEDKNTGLLWQGKLIHPESSPTWSQAQSYCSSLNTDGYGPAWSNGTGTSWRLPTIKELQTIVDYGKQPALNSVFQIEDPNVSYYIWSSTAYNDSFYYAVSHQGLTTGRAATEKYNNRTLCVKEYNPELILPENATFDPANEPVNSDVVRDTSANLYWQTNTFSSLGWDQALRYCENSTEGGYTDWRLPNINELLSLINYSKTSAPRSDFPGINSGKYWTSTPYSQSNDNAFYVNFATGEVQYTGNLLLNARCVRSDLCGEGKFLSGKNCVENPCTSNSCSSVAYSDGVCIPLTESKYSCGCADGYAWESSTSSCIADQCITTDNECTSMEGSNGICTHYDGKIKCGCTEEYFWNGSRCMKKSALGNVCTGQMLCYDATTPDDEIVPCPKEGEDFYGQDCQYASKGTCAPQQPIIQTSLTGEKVIKYKNTGLMWQKTTSDEALDWYHAITYCADLEYAGYDDWRLPTLKELESITNLSYDFIFLDLDIFDADGSLISWTSSQLASDHTRAWSITYKYTNTGIWSGDLKSTALPTVRCVRGDYPSENSSFTVSTKNGQDIVTDNETGHIWQGSYSDPLTWKEALAYCENSEYAGYTDWRMPNMNELISIFNFDKYYNTNATDFPKSLPDGLWTSSSFASIQYGTAQNRALSITTHTGSSYIVNKTSQKNVLCVR